MPRRPLSLEEAGEKLVTFTHFPKSQWKSIRTSPSSGSMRNSSRGSRPRPCCPCTETAAMLFWALMASGQITMRKVDGWESLSQKPADQTIDLAA